MNLGYYLITHHSDLNLRDIIALLTNSKNQSEWLILLAISCRTGFAALSKLMTPKNRENLSWIGISAFYHQHMSSMTHMQRMEHQKQRKKKYTVSKSSRHQTVCSHLSACLCKVLTPYATRIQLWTGVQLPSCVNR